VERGTIESSVMDDSISNYRVERQNLGWSEEIEWDIIWDGIA
jgi:hypothetical protein